MDSEKEVLLTQEGYDNLEKELEYLTTETICVLSSSSSPLYG